MMKNLKLVNLLRARRAKKSDMGWVKEQFLKMVRLNQGIISVSAGRQ